MDAEIGNLKPMLDAFMALDGANVVKLAYEGFWNDHAVIYDAIEGLFGVKVSADERIRLSQAYGIEANLERARRLRDFNEWDEAGVHGAHIGYPHPGGWRMALPEWAHEPTITAMKLYCDSLGYSCC